MAFSSLLSHHILLFVYLQITPLSNNSALLCVVFFVSERCKRSDSLTFFDGLPEIWPCIIINEKTELLD